MGYLERKRDAMIGATPWYLPPTVKLSDCIAAYQFKGASSQNASYQDLTGHGHTLNAPRGASWSKSTGVQFSFVSGSGYQFLTNDVPAGDTLRTMTRVKTVVVYYSGHKALSDNEPLCFSRLAMAQHNAYYGNYSDYDGCPSLYGQMSFQCYVNGQWVYTYHSKYPGILSKWNRDSTETDDSSKWKLTFYRGNASIPQTGILACTPSQLYLNGARMTTTKYTVRCENLLTTEISGNHEGYEILQNRNYYIYAAAFYGKSLGDTEQSDLYNAMVKNI